MDGSPALNLASFVTTYMEDEAEKLMLENLVSDSSPNLLPWPKISSPPSFNSTDLSILVWRSPRTSLMSRVSLQY